MRVAAIDQGTTSTRALVADTDGRAEIVHSVRHTQHHPAPGRVEHDPAELLANIRTCLAAAGSVDAIGIDNQGESCLAWDARDGRPLTPVIVWQDNRTQVAIDLLKADGAEQLTLERAGLPLDFYFSASKLGWIMRHVEEAPTLLRGGHLRLGTSDAWFLDRLCGVFATDPTTASRTSLMNLDSARWDPDLCALFDVPLEALPEIRPTVGDFGECGGVPVTASVVDQQAALYGHGCRRPGDVKITFGTGAFALAITGETVASSASTGLLPTIAWQIGDRRTYALEGGVYDAGAAVEWARRLGLFSDFAALAAFDGPPAIERGLAFVPALSGLACPHWDRTAGALWVGMTADTGPADLCQAVLEGIALRTAEVIFAMASHIPVSGSISIDGGLSRSDYFCGFLADALEREVLIYTSNELTAFGCAALAMLPRLSLETAPGQVEKTYTPRRGAAEQWRNRFSSAVCRSRGWKLP